MNLNILLHDRSEAREKVLRMRNELDSVRNSIGDLTDRIEMTQTDADADHLISARRRARDKERHLLGELLDAELAAQDLEDEYERAVRGLETTK